MSAPPPPEPTLTLTANPLSIQAGESSTLTWSSTNATSCTASGGWSGSKSVNGSESTGPLGATTAYTLDCVGDGGSVSKSVTVTVSAPPAPAPTLTLAANPLSIQAGESSTLTLVVDQCDELHGQRWLERQQAGQRVGIDRPAWRDDDLYAGLRRRRRERFEERHGHRVGATGAGADADADRKPVVHSGG